MANQSVEVLENPEALARRAAGWITDLAAASLAEAVKLCIEATGLEVPAQKTRQEEATATTAA